MSWRWATRSWGEVTLLLCKLDLMLEMCVCHMLAQYRNDRKNELILKPGACHSVFNLTLKNETTGPLLPSGKPTKKYGKSPFSWVNPLFLWPFSIAMLVYHRVCPLKVEDFPSSIGYQKIVPGVFLIATADLALGFGWRRTWRK